MPRARALLHPFYAAGILYRIATAPIHRRRSLRRLGNMARDEVERCWCGGDLDLCEKIPSYGVCRECASYVNLRPPAPEALAELYSLDVYWHGRVLSKGQSPIERRASNDRIDGRVERWLGLVQRYLPEPGDVLEVGCGSGVLLAELARRGYRCTGVEPDERTAAWTAEKTGVEVRSGLFPDVEGLERCGLFCSFDVIEHTRDPEAFLAGAARLLRPGGTAIIQTPIDRYPELDPPFDGKWETVFDDVEHCYAFTDRAMEELARRTGLELVETSERLWLSHEICVFAKAQ